MKLAYRHDIDGLRAIAVLAVIFYHTRVPGFSGGFVGVDVFFVISGYLITSIILNDIREEKFSIARFYERRIRRIFPALFPVIAFVIIVGAYLFDNDAFKHLGRSTLATTLFYSNLLFLKESGYFAAPSLEKPLLHTWSLAVEEQFYILFPMALYSIKRYLKGKYLLWILPAFILSLGASIYGVYYTPSAAFYLVTSRAWELLAGSILALGLIKMPKSIIPKSLLSLTGSGLLIYSIGFYTEATRFPGYNAIAPVLGTVLIIHADCKGKPTVINRILSTRALVFIGLISYSLYLWHWPIVAFLQYWMPGKLSPLLTVAILSISFVLSILSWKFIETPFRGESPWAPERNKLFKMAGWAMFTVVGVSGIILVTQGRAGMAVFYPDLNRRLAAAGNGWGNESDYKKIIINNLSSDTSINPPIIGLASNPPRFMLWGDSHAFALKAGMEYMANKYHVSGILANYTECPPLLDIDKLDTPANEVAINQKTIQYIAENPNIETIILSARWGWYFNGTGYKGAGSNFHLKGHNGIIGQTNHELMRNSLERTVDRLLSMKRRVVLVNDFPEIGYGVPQLYSMHVRFPNQKNMTGYLPTIDEYKKRQHSAAIALEKLGQLPGVTIVHPENRLFDKHGKCIVLAGKDLLYMDDNHLSAMGAVFVAPVFDAVFNTMVSQMPSISLQHNHN